MATTAADIIALLELDRHPEGGWYRQTFEDTPEAGQRAQSTAIYYLLEGENNSHWHRVDAAEVWHWYGGSPLRLRLSHEGKVIDEHVLGPELSAGQRPQVIVPRHSWQTAKSLGTWTLVGCTVAPGFQFSGFELAPKDWSPS
jgi:predicted cupin superfamily sugar epimerase